MFVVKIFILINSLLCLGFGSCDRLGVQEETAAGLNNFAVEFAQAAFKNEKGNAVCSPFSTSMVLMMLALGAKESTFNELQSALHFNLDSKHLSPDNIHYLLHSVEGLQTVHYKLANKIYVANNLKLNSNYKLSMNSVFQSEVESVDFGSNYKVAKDVNKWCAAQTEDKIQNIVDPASISSDMKLMLINTLYFRGEWSFQFEKEDLGNFYLETGQPKTVTMMERNDMIGHKHLEGVPASFIELPYNFTDFNGTSSMFVILPDEGKTLADVDLKKIDLDKLHESWPVKVHLTLPKFVVESTLNLRMPLSQLGLGNLFTPAADLSGMLDDSHALYVSSVLQKTFLEVNEKGTEAASATVGGIVNKFGGSDEPEETVEFRVDRPFYLIVANEYVITFIARVTDPKTTR